MNNRYAIKPLDDVPMLLQPSAAPTQSTGMEDIHPLKPLQDVEFPWGIMLSGLLLLLLFSLAAWLLVKRWLKQQQPESPEEVMSVSIPVTTALEAALKELESLETDILRQDCPAFYFRLEHILRTYLESTRSSPATAMTQTELQNWLKHHGQLLWAPERLKPMWGHSLMAKFAHQVYGLTVLQEDRELVKMCLLADANQWHTKQE